MNKADDRIYRLLCFWRSISNLNPIQLLRCIKNAGDKIITVHKLINPSHNFFHIKGKVFKFLLSGKLLKIILYFLNKNKKNKRKILLQITKNEIIKN